MKEEEEEEPTLILHLIWDDNEMDDIDDDIMEESCVGNDYNLQRKGAPKTNHSPSTSKMNVKKTPTVAIFVERSLEYTKNIGRNPTTAQPITTMDLTQEILGDLKLDYDVVEDLNKLKVTIIVFE